MPRRRPPRRYPYRVALQQLLAGVGQPNRAAVLAALFGGVRQLGDAIDIAQGTVSRWIADGTPRGKGGYVPPEYHDRVRKAAKKIGLHPDKVEECLAQPRDAAA